MKVVLLRVGVDSGAGGMQGPLFADGSFELIPIPDTQGVGLTYGAACGTKGVPLSEYFPQSRRAQMRQSAMHLDPEFTTFTYGDPTKPKSSLRQLNGATCWSSTPDWKAGTTVQLRHFTSSGTSSWNGLAAQASTWMSTS